MNGRDEQRGDRPSVEEFVRRRGAELVARWAEAVEELPHARALERPRLVRHVPELLARIARAAEGQGDARASVEEPAREHARERALDGYDLEEVVAEYAALRRTFVLLWEAEQGRPAPEAIARLHGGLDEAVRVAVTGFAGARQRTVDRLLAELDQSVRLRDDVSAALSHDLAAPLGTIIMSASVLLRRPGLDPALETRLQLIVRSAERADRMIKDLLDVTALASGRASLRLGPCPVPELVHEAVAAAQGEATLLRADLVGAPGQVLGDRDELLRVLGNLVGNALKFSGGGPVTVRAEREGAFVRFAVTDAGPGVPEESRAGLFERGHQGRHGRGGLGLGLSIAKGIVAAHGGQIGFIPRAPGAEFWFTVPVATER